MVSLGRNCIFGIFLEVVIIIKINFIHEYRSKIHILSHDIVKEDSKNTTPGEASEAIKHHD